MNVYGEIFGTLSGTQSVTGLLSTANELLGELSGASAVVGCLASGNSIVGILTANSSINGTITIPSAVGVDPYTGTYEVTPLAYEEQTLETAHKLMEQNVTVHMVPYFETPNTVGNTVYIASEV